jgi:8-oxo-dGTP diphosphatase
MVVIDAGMLRPDVAATIMLPPDELRSWAWSTPDEEVERLSPVLARRTGASRQPRSTGESVYRENG